MTDTGTNDERPPIWAGHLGPLPVTDLAASKAFYRALGLRLATDLDHMASMELRGGTHLVLQLADEAEPADRPFDLMVDDIEATRSSLIAAGLDPTPIEPSGAHHKILVTDPDGHRIPIYTSHIVGVV